LPADETADISLTRRLILLIFTLSGESVYRIHESQGCKMTQTSSITTSVQCVLHPSRIKSVLMVMQLSIYE